MPEVGFEEIAIDLPQARLWITSCLPAIPPLSRPSGQQGGDLVSQAAVTGGLTRYTYNGPNISINPTTMSAHPILAA